MLNAKATRTQFVAAVTVRPGVAEMRDLTVDDVHTYYVIVEADSVLVHNCGTGQPRGIDGRYQSNPNGAVASSNYGRAPLRNSTRAAIRAATERNADGNYVDFNAPGGVIPANGPFHYGHKPGFEYWRNRDMAQDKGWPRKQFIEYENDPSHYRIEDPYNNWSHRFEQP